MKKLLIILFLIVFGLITITPNSHAEDFFRWDYEKKESKTVQGIRYTYAEGLITWNSLLRKHRWHSMTVNLKETDYNVITADSYQPFSFSRASVPAMVTVAKDRFPHLDFVAGINGDFYNTSSGFVYSGQPTETHIVNYQVFHRGNMSSRHSVGFLDDGTLVWGKPTLLGQHLNILNPYGEIKQRIKVDKVNQLPANDLEVAVFYENFLSEIPAGYQKIIVDAADIKTNSHDVRAFSKGTMIERTTAAYTVDQREFVLVGKVFEDENLVLTEDTLIVQELLGNGFDQVRFAMGLGEALVLDGELSPNINTAGPTGRHPRTAIGQALDGTLIMLLVEGRDYVDGYLGIEMPELAYLMKLLGAHTAYNLDGGGSSTMVLYDNSTGNYEPMNFLSDGSIRAVSNGLLLARGTLEPLFYEIPYPDTRMPFEAPNGLYVDDEDFLHFLSSVDYNHYYVSINGTKYYTSSETFKILLSTPGTYEIQVLVKGNETFASSAYSETYIFNYHQEDIKNILDLLRNLNH